MFIDDLVEAASDPILGLKEAFLTDSRSNKIDLGVGNYKDDDLKEIVLPVVKEAETTVFGKEIFGDYLPIDGDASFIKEVGKLVFDSFFEREQDRIFGAQTLGGTGGVRLGGDFLAAHGLKDIYLPNYTWPNHVFIFEKVGVPIKFYPYYSKDKKKIDFGALKQFFSELPETSVILLQASCHNPTGCDLTNEEWDELSKLFQKKRFFPFFDMAYQGLGDGLKEDAWAIKKFATDGHELILATAFSKNFSLYSQRVGTLFFLMKDPKKKKAVASHIKKIIRPMYSNPPSHGAFIVREILRDPKLRLIWENQVNAMRYRITAMRNQLVDLLVSMPCNVNYEYLRNHKGMFSFLNLEKRQVSRLIKDYAIYLPDNGRINVAGLNAENIEYVAKAIVEVS